MKPIPHDQTGRINQIVLLGAGLTLDCAHPDEYSRRAGRLVIGLNAVASVITCDYVILTDLIALRAWGGTAARAPGQYAIAPRGMATVHGVAEQWPEVRWLHGEDYCGADALPFRNTRNLASAVLYKLACQHPAAFITYIGMDSCHYLEIGPQRTWRYAAKLMPAALDDDHRRHIYAGDPANPLRPVKANYRSILPWLYAHFRPMQNRLVCRSLVDWTRVRRGANVESACVDVVSRNPEFGGYRWTM